MSVRSVLCINVNLNLYQVPRGSFGCPLGTLLLFFLQIHYESVRRITTMTTNQPTPLGYMWQEYHRIIEGTLAVKSLSLYRQEFKNFCAWANMNDILFVEQVTPEVTEKYIRYSYSIRRAAPFEIQTLKRIWGMVFPHKDNPWNIKLYNLIRINTPKPMSHRPFTYREVNRLFETFKPMYRYAMLFAYWYGMRIGSICTLNWRDFKNWKRTGKFLHVPIKTIRFKPNYLELPVVPQIESVLSRLEKTTDYLFPQLRERYFKYSSIISHDIKTTITKCKIRDTQLGIASAHSFRTTFITMMDEAGAPVYITDSITGHAPQDMHGLYSKPSVRAKRKWILKALKPVRIQGSIL